jgi:hypothetical protein
MKRVVLKSPVLENCTPGSVRGALGNQRPYLDVRSEKTCVSEGESPSSLGARLPEFGTKVTDGKV